VRLLACELDLALLPSRDLPSSASTSARRDRAGGPLVALLRAVLSRCRGTAGWAWCGGRLRHRLPLDAAVQLAGDGGSTVPRVSLL